jgi:hypothetical protein
MIQRFPFRVFAAALIAAGVAPMAFASSRFTRYRLESFGNLCDMNKGGTNSSAPFLREKQQTPLPFPL